jgi:hypothetical protein
MAPSKMKPAFDESGPVASVDFAYPEDEAIEAPASDTRLARQETVLALLRLLATKGATPHQIGQRVILLLFLLGRGDFRTQTEVAKRLGVSRARVSMAVNKLKATFASICKGLMGH